MNLLTINKQLATLRSKVSARLAAKEENRRVIWRLAPLLLMSFASVLTTIVVRFMIVEAFWHYFLLVTCLVLSLLTLVGLFRGKFFH
jgi:hypothetical protein